jgi:catechol 2,3-dioxygenase-like lactoylglutathione lyase family enzyme
MLERTRILNSSLWNIGIKAEDLDREISFWAQFGARLLLRETLMGPDGDADYALLEFGGTRLFLTPKPLFEDRLAYPLTSGLTHAVFEVENLDREYQRLAVLGTEVLVEPTELSAGFGSRRIALFRSPNGLIFEMMQILESKI